MQHKSTITRSQSFSWHQSLPSRGNRPPLAGDRSHQSNEAPSGIKTRHHRITHSPSPNQQRTIASQSNTIRTRCRSTPRSNLTSSWNRTGSGRDPAGRDRDVGTDDCLNPDEIQPVAIRSQHSCRLNRREDGGAREGGSRSSYFPPTGTIQNRGVIFQCSPCGPL